MLGPWWCVAALWLPLPGLLAAAARLYAEDDPLVVLSGRSLQATVTSSSSAWLVQFYSSWCGHCIQYSGTWKALAQDVREWQQAVGVAVLDCAQEENYDVCKEFNIKFYPTFKYFRAHSSKDERGTIYRGPDRGIQAVRQLLINILQNHTKLDWPESCPPLEPHRSVEVLPLLGQRSDHFTAIVVEEPESYVGREVTLDLLQYSGVQVKRVLSSERPLLDALKITTLPSVYLLHPNGTHSHLHSEKSQRFFFSSLLRTLPGVSRRSSSSAPGHPAAATPSSHTWREFDRSVVYLADLESGLHYLLRVELASHSTLEGAELQVFKDFVTLVAKLYPGGGSVVKLMETLSDWLLSLPLPTIPYQAVLDLVDNKMRISGVFLGAELRWVGCQGSRAGLRGYPCSLWTLFHVLTVQHAATPTALDNTGLEAEPAPVLQVMRRYVTTFFGCQECGRHFEAAAASGLQVIRSPEEQLLWLWQQHNQVNARLAGSLSDDPLWPKAPWPSASLCASCHEEQSGVHVWNRHNVLLFLRRHYGAANLSPQYRLTPPRPPGPRPAGTGRPEGGQPAGGAGAGGEQEEEVERRAEEQPQPQQPGGGQVVGGARGEVGGVRGEVGGVREGGGGGEVGGVRGEVGGVREGGGGEVGGVRGEVGGVRGEVGGVRGEVGGVRGGGVSKEVGGVRQGGEEVGGVREEVGGVRGEVGGVRGEVGGVRGGGAAWTLGFTSVDLSLCVLLYSSSCFVLLLLLFFFRLRSRRWRLTRSRSRSRLLV